MFYQQITENSNTREMISQFRGYNHNYVIDNGEFYDMENLSSDHYPVMSPRKKRALLVDADNVRGITISDGSLAYLDGNVLHVGSTPYYLEQYFLESTDVDEYGNETFAYDASDQTLIRFGAYIVMFPSGVWVNVTDGSTGTIAENYSAPAGVMITYTICDSTGGDLQNLLAGATAPKSPADGDYWLCTKNNEEGLYMYVGYNSDWEAVATCYIRVSIPGGKLSEHFSEGDAVYMNSGIGEIDYGSVLQSVTDEYFVIIGVLDDVQESTKTDSEWTLTIERRVPDLDYVCVSNNRIWGCHYGDDKNGKTINEIYASKLGDFKNWYSYQGLATDSYALSIGEPGEWTGCINYQGYPTFFKENCVMKIYGSMPSEYSLAQHTCRGVQKGSEKSLAIVNEYLVYKSAADICVYDGSTPTSISADLGRDNVYYSAVAAGCLGKYYISMETNVGRGINFVYNMANGMWTKNDNNVRYREFTQSESGQIYGTNGKKIYGLGANDNIVFRNKLPDEDSVEWYGITGDMGLDVPDHKYVNQLSVRAYIPYSAELKVDISYDDAPWKHLAILRGNDDTRTTLIRESSHRCDHYRLRLSGHGEVRVYSVTVTAEATSEDNNYGYSH